VSRYHVTIEDQEFAVDITQSGTVYVNGKSVDVDIAELREGVCSILIDTQSTNVLALRTSRGFDVLIDSASTEVTVETDRERLLRQFSSGSASKTQKLEIHAPMPALVGKIEVNVGDAVVEGQGLLILEAMKMENELKAHHQGTIKQIFVKQGETVEKGALLMLLE
jgi:biotin carboxyl carrier protein